MRKILSSLLLALAATAALLVVPSSSASAVIVPNYFQCDRWNKCVQTNGAFVRGYPVYCRFVFGTIANPNRSISLCQKWV